MKRIFKFFVLGFGLVLMILSCKATHYNSSKKIVQDYYAGLNRGDFNLISSRVTRDVQTLEGDQLLTKNAKELYTQFQWDSIFKPEYSIMELIENDDSVQVTISKTGIRTRFLQDSDLVYKATFDIKNQKITKIKTTDFVFLDSEKWPQRRDELVAWIDIHHPELSGFIYDLTPEGALNYLDAIAFYENRN